MFSMNVVNGERIVGDTILMHVALASGLKLALKMLPVHSLLYLSQNIF
jgi:hypothetical protein